jgi:hypothetical protein
MIPALFTGLLFTWLALLDRLGRIPRSPRSLYRALVSARDWVLTKVEYLQGESAKWRTAFGIIKAPYSLLRGLGFSPQMAGLLLFGSSVAGGGVIAAEVMEGRSFEAGDHGIFDETLGAPIRPNKNGDRTLNIELGQRGALGQVTVSNATVGTAYVGSTLPAGEVNAWFIGGLPEVVDGSGVVTFIETFLYIGYLTVEIGRCDTFLFEESEVYDLQIRDNNSDGHSVGMVTGLVRNRRVGGGVRADARTSSGSFYDQIKIHAPYSGLDGRVNVVTLSNILASGGPCVLSRIRAGNVDILFNETGLGDGNATKDFVITNTVICVICNDARNTENSVSPPTAVTPPS